MELALNMKIYAFDNKILALNNTWLRENPYVPPFDPNPLGLPALTIRVRVASGASAPSPVNATVTAVQGQTDVYDICTANTSRLDSWSSLLYNSNAVEVLGANAAGVTNMNNMFDNCNLMTSVPFFDTSSVTKMSSMFYRCNALTNVPLFDTTNVTIMYGMFENCYALTSVPLFYTANVTNMQGMFRSCTSLTTVPLFDTSSARNMSSMFKGCTALTTVPLLNTSAIVNTGDMFYNCTSVESGALALYQQLSTQANPPTYHSHTFYQCGSNTVTGAAELSQIPSDWK